ncbi:hypothetical protein V492_00619 [Pseudogymnoascus sp. VKM F-4246]|nr:hypothetical protein V492_00619 [Pseudogymnoascus sp. VKM F-4246]
MRSQSILTAAAAIAVAKASKDVLPTPPMGFNNWARFMCDLNETLFTQTADAMVSSGLLAAGYDRINLDDCWMQMNRTDNGTLLWDEEKFPQGLPWLGRYLKQKGFHFGIYQDAGTATCGGYPGSLGFEQIDADTFTNWGIDYLKLDGCNVPTAPGRTDEETFKDIYSHWHEILDKQANPLIFSESAPAYFCGMDNLTDWYTIMDWLPENGELARHSYDVATWGDKNPWASIMTNYDQHIRVARYQSPGFFNDPDFLVSDYPELTIDEKRSQFALWASFSAPLIISAHIPDLGKDEIAFLTNKDLIDVDQDALSEQATLASRDSTWDVLTKSLANGDRLLAVLNRSPAAASTSIPLAQLGLSSTCKFGVKDLWTGDASAVVSGEFKIKNVPSHGTVVYRLTPSKNSCKAVTPTGIIMNTFSMNCMTAGAGAGVNEVASASCDFPDTQVWQVRADGSIRNLEDESKCLTDSGNGPITTVACKGNQNQIWSYALSGDLTNKGTGKCLTEGVEGQITTQGCAFETNNQVYALPVGVKLQ